MTPEEQAKNIQEMTPEEKAENNRLWINTKLAELYLSHCRLIEQVDYLKAENAELKKKLESDKK